MSFPGERSITYKICSLLRNGAMNSQAICDAITEHGAKVTRVAIFKAHEEGFIEVSANGDYTLTRIMRRHLDQCEKQVEVKPVGEIVPPRTPQEFRPLSTKNMPHLAPRREAIREVSFLNGSSGFQVGYRV